VSGYKNHFFEAMIVLREDGIIHDEYLVLNILG
jgi:hypothetical protein